MGIEIAEVLKAVGGSPVGIWNPGLSAACPSTDTRSLGKGDIFFALKGPRFDGHDFIPQALEKGAGHFVISRAESVLPQHQGLANFILVPDTLKAYGDLAAVYRRKFKIPAVAVTGSSGKTTVKELLAHILSLRWKVLKNQGTENNFIGVPKTLFRLDSGHQAMVLEMGTNHPGEIDRLSSIIHPQVAVVTQIGYSHLEGLGTLEGVRDEKLKVMDYLERGGKLVLNGEDPMLAPVRDNAHQVLRVGFLSNTNDVAADSVVYHERGSSFRIVTRETARNQGFLEDFCANGGSHCETQLLGRHNVLNCLLAVSAAASFGLEGSVIREGLRSFKAVNGRLDPKTLAGIHFIDDSYNSNPNSFQAALETLNGLKSAGRRGVVCGDMLELGEASERMHRRIGAYLAGLSFDFVIAVGPLSRHLADEAVKAGFDSRKMLLAGDSRQAGEICRRTVRDGDAVLVKGSRSMKMERVFECFITSSTR